MSTLESDPSFKFQNFPKRRGSATHSYGKSLYNLESLSAKPT